MLLDILIYIYIVSSHILVHGSAPMFSKNQIYQSHGEENAGKRFKENVSDLFLSGTLSAHRTRLLFNDAQCSDPAETARLAAVSEGSHAHRDMVRKMRKTKKWPPVFNTQIVLWNKKDSKEEVGKVSLMLPHEIVWAIAEWNNHNPDFYDMSQLKKSCFQHLISAAAELKMDASRTIPVAMWLDGIPVKYDRSESLEVVTLNMPHLQQGGMTSMRIPLAALYKSHMAKNVTMDGIMRVFSWSLACLAEGCFPKYGPYGELLQGWRGKKAGQVLPPGLLVEVRGDWAAFKSTFRLPGWNDKEQSCYRCFANHQQNNIRDCSATATWRSLPMDHWQNLWRIKNKHGDIPPLFGAPGFRSSVFSIDWLHAADQGVSADFLANLMTTILAQWEGTEKEKLGRLFAHIQKYYKDVQAESRLDNLTAGMIRKDSNKSPKLRSKAGECRALIGWIPRACTDFLDPANPEHAAATQAGLYLHECYACLSVEHFDKDKLATAARKFLTIMNALESFCEHERRWRWKPKFHIWLHLCEESLDSPSLSWVYRDEDFGGSLSRISTRRGGNNTAQAVSAMVLNMFFARNEIPVLEC